MAKFSLQKSLIFLTVSSILMYTHISINVKEAPESLIENGLEDNVYGKIKNDFLVFQQ